jgi:hypothetical protein
VSPTFFHPLTLGVARRTAPPSPDDPHPKRARHYEAWQEGVRPRVAYDPHPEARVLERFRQAAERGVTRLWVVLGEPGAGKTRLMDAWFQRWASDAGPPRLGMTLPVLVRLRRLKKMNPEPDLDGLADRLWALAVEERGLLEREAAAPYRLQACRMFRPAWMLDGLDEVPDLLGPDLFAAMAALPGAKLLTCRSAVFQSHRPSTAPYQEQAGEYGILPLPEGVARLPDNPTRRSASGGRVDARDPRQSAAQGAGR